MKSVSLSALLALGSAGVAWAEPAWTTLPTEAGVDVVFADSHHGFFGTGAGDLYRTLNGGQSWEKIWTQPGLRALGFIDAAHGFLGADQLYESRDGGLTWQPTGNFGVIHTIDIVQPGIIEIAAGNTWLRSETRGATWREIHRSASDRKTSFPRPEIGYALLGESIAKTIDGGKSWIDLPLPEAAQAIGFLTADQGWVSGYETVDGGLSWHPSALAKSTRRIRTSAADGTPMVYAIGGEVQVYR